MEDKKKKSGSHKSFRSSKRSNNSYDSGRSGHKHKRSRRYSSSQPSSEEEIVWVENTFDNEEIPNTSDFKSASSSVTPISKDDLNKLKAKSMKAHMLGDPNAEQIEQQYKDQLYIFNQNQSPPQECAHKQNSATIDVALPILDMNGIPYNISKKIEILNSQTTDSLSASNMKEMALRDKLDVEAKKADESFAKKALGYKSGFDLNTLDALDNLDNDAEFLASVDISKSKESTRTTMIQDLKRTDKIMLNCNFCFQETPPSSSSRSSDTKESTLSPKVPVVAIGHYTYLSLPLTEPLTDGQCSINIIEHWPSGSCLVLDQNVWDEIRNFQKCLTLMFHEKGYGTIFMETNKPTYSKVGQISFNKHISIECFPLPYRNSIFSNTPMYFKQSILSADEEWSVHKKLIDTRIQKHAENGLNRSGGFRSKMTPKVPYFHVWFDLDGGYGHVIENSQSFRSYFGHEVVAGILNLPPKLYKHPNKVIFNQKQKLKAIEEWKSEFSWDKYDWTASLD